MKKGIVMEVNKRFLTILTPDGEFLRAQNQSNACQIGQEINFIPISMEEKKNLYEILIKRKWAISAAIAVLFFFSFSFSYYQSNQVYAYMSIDINPSLELAVNKEFEVLDIVPFNEDGKQIVSQLHDWNKKDIQDVTDAILDEVKKQGYMEKNNEVVISRVNVKGNNEDREIQWENEMKEIKSNVEKENIDLNVVEGTKEEREKAKENGLTTGLYKENKARAEKKKNEEKKAKENSSIQNTIPSVEVPSENIQRNTDNGKSEMAPGQLKQEVKRNEMGNSKEKSGSLRQENGNSVKKEKNVTRQEQSQNLKSNRHSEKQQDKNPNSNSGHPNNENQKGKNSNSNKEHQNNKNNNKQNNRNE